MSLSWQWSASRCGLPLLCLCSTQCAASGTWAVTVTYNASEDIREARSRLTVTFYGALKAAHHLQQAVRCQVLCSQLCQAPMDAIWGELRCHDLPSLVQEMR